MAFASGNFDYAAAFHSTEQWLRIYISISGRIPFPFIDFMDEVGTILNSGDAGKQWARIYCFKGNLNSWPRRGAIVGSSHSSADRITNA
jgi:hypothetical protein